LRGGGCRTGGALGGERGPQATRFVNAVVSAGLGGHAPSGVLRRAGRRPAGDTQGDGTRLFLRGYLRGFGMISLSDTIKRLVCRVGIKRLVCRVGAVQRRRTYC